MSVTQALRAEPGLLIVVCTLFGLVVGSFLNVLALRLPRMMQAAWKRESRQFLGLPPEEDPSAALSLWSPPSTCPACGARIRPWHNIPLLGWLALRGRCADCRAPISLQYPLVETATGAAAAVCAWRFGFSAALVPALVLSFALIAAAAIDWREQLLPDTLTLPLLWLGLLLSCVGVFTTPRASILGAALGYLFLWSIYQLFKLATGKEGMGYGDFKLLAALGAWFGAGSLILIVLLSSLVGALVGLSLIAFAGQRRDQPIPFGPYLAGAGWIVLIWGPALHRALPL
jgi:leader peptidase (prepilin peptidase)/N-methyltransferase